MKRKILMRTILFASLGLIFTTAAIAGPHHWRGQRNWQTPTVLTEACAGKAVGTKVNVQTPCGIEVEGVCTKRGEEVWANIGNGWPCGGGWGGRHHWRGCGGPGYYWNNDGAGYVAQPGPANDPIRNACEGKGKGAKVNFEMPDGTKVDITCGDK